MKKPKCYKQSRAGVEGRPWSWQRPRYLGWPWSRAGNSSWAGAGARASNRNIARSLAGASSWASTGSWADYRARK